MLGGKNNSHTKPTALGSMLQASSYGMTISTVIGTVRSALLAIYAAHLRQGKCHGKKKKSWIPFVSPPQYVENIDFLIGSNPIQNVLQLWYNSSKAHLNFVTQLFSMATAPASVTITDSHFYVVIAVTYTPGTGHGFAYNFNDYGGQGAVSGVTDLQEFPLWNAALAGPNPTFAYGSNPALQAPNGAGSNAGNYRWLPSYGSTIYLDANISGNPVLYPGTLTVYYAQTSATIQHQTPIADNCLTFEPQLGSGPSGQPILYPQYAGLASPDIDLGASGVIPAVSPEVMGAHTFYSRGDADFVDMIADTILSGQIQLGIDLGEIQRGVNCCDYPGAIQVKQYGQLDPSNPQIPYNFNVTAGNFLVVSASVRGSTPPITISDTQGNSWTAIYNGPGGTSHAFAVFICQANASGPNTIHITGGYDCGVQLFEIGGLDTLDGSAVFSSLVPAVEAGQITTTNQAGQPGYALALSYIENDEIMTQKDVHWDDILNGLPVGGAGALNFGMASQKRNYYYPSTLTIKNKLRNPDFTWNMVLLTFKNSQPVPFTQALGNILDTDSFELTRQQCRAAGLIGSVAMNSQRSAADWIKDFLTCANAAPVWNGFKLQIIPRSEVSAVGQGAIYVSPTASGPVANLTENDLIGDSSQPLITIERRAQVDSPNIFQAEILDRDTDYNPLVVSWPDAGSVALYGPRKDNPQTLHMIMDPTVARMILAIQARRSADLRNIYKFKAKANQQYLTPMDLVTITDSKVGINKLPVRITSIEEDEEFNLDMEAEPFIYGVNAPNPAIQSTAPNPNSPSIGNDPGSVNAPIIFEAVPRLTNFSSVPQLWLAVSGASVDYGGCLVFISTDGGVSYNPAPGAAGSIVGNAIMGVTTADWPAAADPDTSNDLSVDLTESLGTLQSYQVADENNFTYPCYVGGGLSCITYELMTYAVATLTAANKYTLKATGGGTNELRRAVFSAPQAVQGVDHPLGSAFAFLSPAGTGIAKIPIDPSWIGKTLFFKFLAFNTFLNNVQSLAAATPYSYTITGCPSSGQNPNSNNYTVAGGALTQPCATPTEIDMAQATVTFPSNTAIYNARKFTIPTPTAPTIYYVTIFDPAFLGDTNSATPTFSDNFSSGTLDTSKWQANSWTIPNYAGAGSTDTSDPTHCDLSGGSMRLTLTQPSSGAATGCEIQSLNKFGFGTYEWSIRASSTSATSGGAGTAVSGQISTGFIISDPTSKTEIDCPEIEGRTPTIAEFTNWLNGVNAGASSIPTSFNPQDGFHRYKLVWSATSVLYYIDDVLVATHTTDIPLAINPAYVLISHYGTNSNTFGGLATVGTTRYLYCNSFKYWSSGVTTNLPAYAETSTVKVGQAGYVYIGSIVALPGGCGGGTGPGGQPTIITGLTSAPAKSIAIAPGAAGNFTVPHGLGVTPAFVLVEMTDGSSIWLQSPTHFDNTNIYLVAGDASAAGIAYIWTAAADVEVSLAPGAAGNFTVAHGLGTTPTLALIEMLSSGAIWFQNPPWDATNLYLVASDTGITAKAEVLTTHSTALAVPFEKIPLAPVAAGNFTIPHGLAHAPTAVVIRMTSGGLIWLQSPTHFDATNIYLVASDGGVTGEAEIWG